MFFFFLCLRFSFSLGGQQCHFFSLSFVCIIRILILYVVGVYYYIQCFYLLINIYIHDSLNQYELMHQILSINKKRDFS